MKYPHLRRIPTIALATALAFTGIVGAGAFAAQSLTVTVLAASGPPAALLPASTALYAEVNIHPGATQAANLQTISRAFTSQPGFANLRAMLTSSLNSSQGSATCTNGTQSFSWNSQVLSWINGTVAVAATDPAAFSSNQNAPAAKDGMVVIAGLKVQQSIADIILSHQLGSAALATTYQGTSIYTIQDSSTCAAGSSSLTSLWPGALRTRLFGGGNGGVPGTTTTNSAAYAAVLNGYALLGQTPASIEREIDVFRGTRPALSQSASYLRLMAAVPSDRLAYLYMDTPAVLRAAAASQNGKASVPGVGSGSTALPPQLTNAVGPLVMTVSARPNGVSVQTFSIVKTPAVAAASVTPNAAINVLPAGSLFYESIDNLKALYQPLLNEIASSSSGSSSSTRQTIQALQLAYGPILNLLNGEVALGLLPTNMNALTHLSDKDTTSLPLVMLVDVSKHPNAMATVNGLLATISASDPTVHFSQATTANGNTLYAAPAGYGYARIGRWLVVSTSIRGVAASIEGVLYGHQPSFTSGKIYQRVANAIAGRKTSVSVINLQALRTGLEALLPANASAQDRQTYAMLRPLLVPLRALSIASSADTAGNISRVNMFLAIG
jgi:hypothetical protein